jgi:ABC-type nitrate/sulfonate/bicarbonate transport system substrate-binding protein
MKIKIAAVLLLLVVAVVASRLALRTPPSSPVTATQPAPDYDKYDYGRTDGAKVVDIATQPNAIFTSESLFHDRILQRQLAEHGWTLREHRYRNGREMVPYTDGRLDVMVLGDIPAFIAMTEHRVGIFALCRQGYNTVVANRRITAKQLKGLHIGYPPNTTAHFTLDRVLAATNLTMKDITSVPMPPDQMDQAFRSGAVDAIVSWEPTASSILAIPGSTAVSSSEGFSYIAMDLGFAARHPAIQKAILAAVVRAVNWTRLDEQNIRTNLLWDRDAAVKFFGRSPVAVNEKWIGLMRKETIDNPSFPMLPLNFTESAGIQHQQFEFLKRGGMLPVTADWKTVIAQVDTGLLPQVVADKSWQTAQFDYASDKLYPAKVRAP